METSTTNHYLQIVEIKDHPSNQCEMEFAFYLAFVKQSTVNENEPETDTEASDLPKVFLRVQTMVEFDTFVATHGPATHMHGT